MFPTVPTMTELLTHANGIPAVTGAPASRDFTRPRKRITFRIDGDVFEAAPVLPGEIYATLVERYNDTADVETYRQQYELLKSALELVLLPESYERFAARLGDRANPIDGDQMADCVLWLLEVYGLRPTGPSQPSSDGPASPESGTSSTANTHPLESTSALSQPTSS